MLPAVALKSSLRLTRFSTCVVVESTGRRLAGAVAGFASSEFIDPCGALAGDAPVVNSSAASGAARIKRPTETAKSRNRIIQTSMMTSSKQLLDFRRLRLHCRRPNGLPERDSRVAGPLPGSTGVLGTTAYGSGFSTPVYPRLRDR